MSSSTRSIRHLYGFAGPSLAAALDGLDADAADHRWRDGRGSSIRFLAGHLLACRASILVAIGARTENPWEAGLGGTESTPDTAPSTPLAELVADWRALVPEFDAALAALDEDALAAPGPEGLPVGDGSVGSMIDFLAWHEAYHIGQIGLMRVELGLPSFRDAAIAAAS